MPESNELLSAGAHLIGMPLAGPESFSQQQLDYLKRALGVDETVLYTAPNDTAVKTCTLSETVANFERIRVIGGVNSRLCNEIDIPSATFVADVVIGQGNNQPSIGFIQFSISDTTMTASRSVGISFSGFSGSATYRFNNDGELLCINKVVGINRIAGGN